LICGKPLSKKGGEADERPKKKKVNSKKVRFG